MCVAQGSGSSRLKSGGFNSHSKSDSNPYSSRRTYMYNSTSKLYSSPGGKPCKP